MGLKELLLQRSGNPGNLPEMAEVTGKSVLTQRGNPSNLGNLGIQEGLGGTGDTGGAGTEKLLTRLLFSEVTKVTEVTALKTKAESGNLTECAEVTEVTDPADWQGEAEGVAPQPAPAPHRPSLAPASGSLVQRLVAEGATVRSWGTTHGAMSEVEAPAGIPAELLREIEARGWRIIPGGRANAEAMHDSWLAGVPKAELR